MFLQQIIYKIFKKPFFLKTKKVFDMINSNCIIFLDLPGCCGQNKNQSLQKPSFQYVVSDFCKIG